jgi:hypothetical protein
MKKLLLLLIGVCAVGLSFSQSAEEMAAKLKSKLLSVKDYEAKGMLKTDVAFLKLPISTVRIFYKFPDLFRINPTLDNINKTPLELLKIVHQSLNILDSDRCLSDNIVRISQINVIPQPNIGISGVFCLITD